MKTPLDFFCIDFVKLKGTRSQKKKLKLKFTGPLGFEPVAFRIVSWLLIPLGQSDC